MDKLTILETVFELRVNNEVVWDEDEHARMQVRFMRKV